MLYQWLPTALLYSWWVQQVPETCRDLEIKPRSNWIFLYIFKVIFLPFCYQFWVELDWDLLLSKTSWNICNKVLTLKLIHTAISFHSLSFHAADVLVGRWSEFSLFDIQCKCTWLIITGLMLHLQMLFVLVNKFQLTSVSSFHKFQFPVLCFAYCNSAIFSDLNIAGSHYYPFLYSSHFGHIVRSCSVVIMFYKKDAMGYFCNCSD
jgi:hypothetical protein